MENSETPTALLLSRQNINDIPVKSGSNRFNDALKLLKELISRKIATENPMLFYWLMDRKLLHALQGLINS